jgi:hypothetical protein
MASSVPAARTALYEGLAALTGTGEPLENVGVYRTGLWKETQAHDRVVVLNASGVDREVAALARPAPFREDYTLNVAFEVYRSGDGMQVVEDRLWELITAVEQYVMANPTLGGAVSQALPMRVEPEQSGPHASDEDSVLAMATLRIACWARVLLN